MNQGQYVLSQVNDAIAALISQDPNMIIGLYQDSQGNIIQPPTAVISFTYCVCVAQAEAAGVVSVGHYDGSIGVQCHMYPQLMEDGSGNGVSMLNDVGGYPGPIGAGSYSMVQLAADPSLGFYDTMVGPNGANAGCQAYNQSIQVPGCRFPNACNYDPLATTGNPNQYCTWGPAGPNYGPLVNPHPCPPVITPLVAGCTVVQSSNYDMYADGCEVNGIIDPNDVTCCTQTQPGGGVTPTDIGPTMATQGKQLTTPTPPDPSDPGMKRMKDLAFRGKR